MIPVFKCVDIIKIFPHPRGMETFATLRGITFEVYRGDFTTIIGPSGCGKSTLLNIITGFLKPSAGSVSISNKSLLKMDQAEVDEYRRNFLGFVPQNPQNNVVWNLNVQDNLKFQILMGNKYSDKKRSNKLIQHFLNTFNLLSRAKAKINQLSGGEIQRLGLITALINDPLLIVLDEPTSQLDHENSMKVILYLKNLCTKQNKSVVMVSHDWKILKYSTKVYSMGNGIITAYKTQ
ncbi:MAG: ABC transporter ATP-binding protein [Candidatus Hermodarchaeota archaeon]